jgi:hypothetical protein
VNGGGGTTVNSGELRRQIRGVYVLDLQMGENGENEM